MTDDVLQLRRPRESAWRRAWHSYRVEIILILMAVAGLLLIFERSQARLAFERVVRWLTGAVEVSADSLLALLGRFSLSDVLGLLLVGAGLGVIVWRVRWRAMRNPGLTTLVCPDCGGVIRRVRRHFWDRMLNLVVPVRRYRCANPECRWKGLRVAVPKGAPQPVPAKARRQV